MICEKCKSEIRFDMNYCPFCGTPTRSQINDQKISLIKKIKEDDKKKEYNEIAKYALSGNAFAEYVYNSSGIDGERIMQEAERNNAAAITMIGIRQFLRNRPQNGFFTGPTGGGERYEKAIQMIKKAAEMKDPSAMSILGEWYTSGAVEGIPKNEREAYKYTKSAADLDEPSALYRLGKWHLDGTNGVSKNSDIGQVLIGKAAYYGIPAAVKWLEERYKKADDTDIKVYENKETQELSIKLLVPFNKKCEEWNIKKNYEENISVEELIDFDFRIPLFDSRKTVTYKNERDFILKVTSGCDTLDDCIEAWVTLQKNNFVIYDPTLDIINFRKKICDKADINIENFDDFVVNFLKKLSDEKKDNNKKNDNNEINDSIEKSDITPKINNSEKIDSNVKKTENYIRNNLSYITYKNNQLLIENLYGLIEPPLSIAKSILHNSGKCIRECRKLNNIMYALRIPVKESVYFVCLTAGSHYTKNASGYAIASTGIYFKSEKKDRPIIITWNNYKKTNICLGEYSKKTKENALMINNHKFLFKFSSYNLDFLLKLKKIIC